MLVVKRDALVEEIAADPEIVGLLASLPVIDLDQGFATANVRRVARQVPTCREELSVWREIDRADASVSVAVGVPGAKKRCFECREFLAARHLPDHHSTRLVRRGQEFPVGREGARVEL